MKRHCRDALNPFYVFVFVWVALLPPVVYGQALCGCTEPADFNPGQRFESKMSGFSQFWNVQISAITGPHELTVAQPGQNGTIVLDVVVPDSSSWFMDLGENFIVLVWYNGGVNYVTVYRLAVNSNPSAVIPVFSWSGTASSQLNFLGGLMMFQTFSQNLHYWSVDIYDMYTGSVPQIFYSYNSVSGAWGTILLDHNKLILAAGAPIDHLMVVDLTSKLPILTTTGENFGISFSGCGAVMGATASLDSAHYTATLYSMADGATLAEETYLKSKGIAQFIAHDGIYALNFGIDTLPIIPVTCSNPCTTGVPAGISINPSPVSGQPIVGTLQLLAPPTTDTYYTIFCTSSSVHVSPVLVKAGQSSAAFSFPTDVVSAPTFITFSTGAQTPRTSVTLMPPAPSMAQFWPYTNPIQSGSTARFQLAVFPEPDSGATVVLASGDSITLPVPSAFHVDAGGSALSIPTPVLGNDRDISLTASYGGVTIGIDLKVLGPKPSLITLDECINGGTSQNVTLMLTNPAPIGGLMVPLVSTDTVHLHAPVHIFVPAAATQVSFTTNATPVQSTAPVALLLTLNGTTVRLGMTVQPPHAWGLTTIPPMIPGDPLTSYFSTAYGINDSGDIVGVMHGTAGKAGFIFHGGISTATMDTSISIALPYAISDNGLVAGSLNNSPAMRQGTSWTALITAEGQVTAVNDSSHAAGWYSASSGRHAFFYDDTLRDLGTLGGSYSEAAAMNSSDIIAGWSNKDAVTRRPFKWSRTEGMQELPVPAGTRDAFAFGINKDGVAVGQYADTNWVRHACKWEGGLPQDLDPFDSWATSINDAGQTVGFSNGGPVLWDGAVRTRLDSIPAFDCQWDRSIKPVAINNRGQIIGNRNHPLIEADLAQVLTIPQPSTAGKTPHVIGNARTRALPTLVANSVRGAVVLRCFLDRPVPARIELYEIGGKRIAIRDLHGEGMQTIELRTNSPLATGVYLALLQQGSRLATARVVLVR